MAEGSLISWTDNTFNPWIGCTRISPACDNCYAADWGHRFGYTWNAPPVKSKDANWKKPMTWQRKAAAAGTTSFVFCSSLADVFDKRADKAWREELWRLVAATPNLIWLVLTKRPQNVHRLVPPSWFRGAWPKNVWIGVTLEDADRDRRLNWLASFPAPVRFVSMEPLLEAVDIRPWLRPETVPTPIPAFDGRTEMFNNHGLEHGKDDHYPIDWVIAGGESGPRARVSDPDWFRDLRDACADAGTPFHFKQWGAQAPGRELDGVTHDGRPTPYTPIPAQMALTA